MSLRRLLPLLVLLALLFAPFGRMAAAEAMTMPHPAAAAMAGHCQDMPAPAGDRSGQAAFDCLTACAVMTSAAAPALAAEAPLRAMPSSSALPAISGLHPAADPPPPRLS